MVNNSAIPRMETINETARLTGLKKYHVRQLVLQNRVKFIKAGKKFLINFQSVIEYLNCDNKSDSEEAETNTIRKVGA